ncbi:MAG: hypothetical protein NT155_00695 [Candidatus Staskawiczbacteria bacterium]|nr:hypothetical protein [Candidatus Staskawiczbacteria bacterium]
MVNKFTLVEFIDACNNDPILKFSGIEITKNVILKSGIKPKLDGFYHRSQMMDLGISLAKHKAELKSILDEPNDDILTLNPSSIDTAAKNIQLQHILYLLLTDNFQQFVKEKRNLFLIPKNGFTSYEERASWLNKLGKEIKRFSKNKLSLNQAMSFIWTSVNRIVDKECEKYSLSSRSAIFPYEYFILDYFLFNDPFFNKETTDSLAKERGLPTQYKVPVPQKNPQSGTFELNILTSRETTKDDVIRTLDKEWETISSWQKRLPPIPNYRKKSTDNLRRDFTIYQLNKNGLNDEEIKIKIGGIELNHIRKIISDTKKRIEETWGD